MALREQYSENYLKFWRKYAKMFLYIYGVGKFISSCLRNYGRRTWLWQTEMRQLLSARLGRSIAPFFSACQVLFHTTYSEPVARDRAHYVLASAFCVCRKDGGLILKSWLPPANKSFFGMSAAEERTKWTIKRVEELLWRKNYLQSYSAL